MEKIEKILNKEVFYDLEIEIYDLRQLALRLKLLDEYRDNSGDELAIGAMSCDIDELRNISDSISVLFNQLTERIVTPSDNVQGVNEG